jgi:hypothetical protein
MADLVPVDYDPFAGDPAIPAMPPGAAAPSGSLAAALAGAPALPPRWQGSTAPAPSWTRPATLAELSVPGRDAIVDPFGNLTTDPTGLGGMVSGIANLPVAVEAHRDKIAAMREAGYPEAQIADEARNNPLYNAAFTALAGPVAGRLAASAGALAPEITPTIGRFLADESGELRLPGARVSNPLDTPVSDALKQQDFIDQLRAQHLARDDGLPLSGATQPVSPPPHIQSMDDLNGLVGRYADLAEAGRLGRDWYSKSGTDILYHAGDPEGADRFAASLAGTSPKTDVAGNAAYAANAWNQAMAGEPALQAGRFPQAMGQRVQRYLYEGAPVTGEKIGPFLAATGAEWNPDYAHAFVNDVWNMRALEYPPELGKVKNAPYYDGTPTLGQHNFARIVGDLAADELERRNSGEEWLPQQTQAAAWTGIKHQIEGTPVGEAAFNFADALKSLYAQQSWESAPGKTAVNHLPEYHTASSEDQQAFHDAMRSVLVDDQGRDIIQRHLGLLTGPTFEGQGVFQGGVHPGTQSQAVAGPAYGGMFAGVDPATKDMLTVDSALHGLLLRQDASAWSKPVFRESLKPGQANMADIDIGRPLTTGEAQALTEAMAKASGTDWFSPIATRNGARFLNVPDPEYGSGLTNTDFHKAVVKALGDDRLPDSNVRLAYADSGYFPNDWSEDPRGQSYLAAITGTGRPDLERRAAEILATLGPRVSEVENHFRDTLGWTPDPSTRVWENNPTIERFGNALVPNPPRPWIERPAAPGSRPPLLVPVDHDPFAAPP